MIVVIEVNKPFCPKPGMFNSTLMRRFWWGYFAIAFLKCESLKEYGERCGNWRLESNDSL